MSDINDHKNRPWLAVRGWLMLFCQMNWITKILCDSYIRCGLHWSWTIDKYRIGVILQFRLYWDNSSNNSEEMIVIVEIEMAIIKAKSAENVTSWKSKFFSWSQTGRLMQSLLYLFLLFHECCHFLISCRRSSKCIWQKYQCESEFWRNLQMQRSPNAS